MVRQLEQQKRIRDFVDTYRKQTTKPQPPITIRDLMKDHNHEIWRTCKNCGNEEDLRKDTCCTVCGNDLLKQ